MYYDAASKKVVAYDGHETAPSAARKREPVCIIYRASFYICTMSPPSSGGIAIAQSLGTLENFELSK